MKISTNLKVNISAMENSDTDKIYTEIYGKVGLFDLMSV